jgi:hypothetical protein
VVTVVVVLVVTDVVVLVVTVDVVLVVTDVVVVLVTVLVDDVEVLVVTDVVVVLVTVLVDSVVLVLVLVVVLVDVLVDVLVVEVDVIVVVVRVVVVVVRTTRAATNVSPPSSAIVSADPLSSSKRLSSCSFDPSSLANVTTTETKPDSDRLFEELGASSGASPQYTTTLTKSETSWYSSSAFNTSN